MIECPNCSHQEFVGTLFCGECGARLVHASPLPTVDISKSEIDDRARATKPSPPKGPELKSGAMMGLRLIETGEVVSLIGRENFTLGRAIEDQAVIPDIDLDRFDAYDHGVSRLHAELRLGSNGIQIIDLDSVNGTLVNGEELESQTPHHVRHGDIVQLGRLRLQLISRQSN